MMVLMYLLPYLGSGLQGEGVLQGEEGGIKLRFGQVNQTNCEKQGDRGMRNVLLKLCQVSMLSQQQITQWKG